jgi:hypothetical protein
MASLINPPNKKAKPMTFRNNPQKSYQLLEKALIIVAILLLLISFYCLIKDKNNGKDHKKFTKEKIFLILSPAVF